VAAVALVILGLVGSGVGCTSGGDRDPHDEPITLFAAASLTDVMDEIARALADSTGLELRISTAASSVLAQQIVHGAGADVFASADPRWMDLLVERARVSREAVRPFASNRLVLITPRSRSAVPGRGAWRLDPEVDPRDLVTGRLALADPEHVPAGMHARAALTWLGWWTLLEDRLLPAADARATLALVATGSVDAGIVYATDARASDDVVVAATFPREAHPPIRYVIAPTVDATPGSHRVLSFLSSRVAVGILVEHGFVVIDD